MNSVGHAVLFKSTGDDSLEEQDPYAQQIELLDITCHVVPVINFEFVNLDELNTRLDHPDLYSGIIFSSPRCVEAVKTSVNDSSLWKNHKAFAVGEKTAKDVYVQLGMTPEGESSGSGKELAEYILSQPTITKPLLLPVGNISNNVLVTMLRGGGLKIDHLIVYNTIQNPKLESLFKPAFEENQVKFVLYFSPSGVENTYQLYSKYNIDITSLKIGAIGRTTEEALKKHCLNTSFIAEKPTPHHFAKALQKILN